MFTSFVSSVVAFVRSFLNGLAGGWWWFGVVFLLVLAVLLIMAVVFMVWGLWWWLAWPLASWAARLGFPRLACALMMVLPVAPGPNRCRCGAGITPLTFVWCAASIIQRRAICRGPNAPRSLLAVLFMNAR
jgi:hypothetical protein